MAERDTPWGPTPRPPARPTHRLPDAVYWRRRTVVAGLAGLTGLGVVRGLGWLTGGDGGDGAVGSSGDGSSGEGDGSTTTNATDDRNIIQIENAKPGTTDFAFPFEPDVLDKISGYADRDSCHRGDTVRLFVSTAAPQYTVEAFRFGWYGGAGARKVWEAPGPLTGVEQAAPSRDRATNMVECAWQPSLEVAVTDDWTPGMYLFRLRSSDGGGHFVPLVVLDDRPTTLLVISAITTWAAYNDWGGASLYAGEGGNSGRAYVVSFDRPGEGSGSGHFFGGEYELCSMAESMGIDVCYTTNVDLHARPDQITAQGIKAVVSLAHDEYYSLEMRTALEGARDAGVNLAFLGANAIFRRVRLEPSPNGPHRRLVNYRVANKDPLFGTGDDTRVTAEWRDEPGANPECALIGNYYESNPTEADMVVVNAASWIFAGTGLADGAVLPGLVGNEYDRVTPEAPGTPTNIEVLCHSPLVCRDKDSFADVTYYTAPSGAGVFATGTLWWERHLGPLCDAATAAAPDHSLDCHVRRITANVLEAFVAGPAGVDHPSVPNLEALGIHPGYVTDPPPT